MLLVPVSRPSPFAVRGFDRALERFFGASAAGDAEAFRSPALDVAENDQQYTVQLDVPGIAKDDVQVSIDGRRVTVQAQTKKTEEAEGEAADRLLYRERTAASYSRSFTLPVELEQTESAAKLENGVLTLTLAKRRAAATQRITVN